MNDRLARIHEVALRARDEAGRALRELDPRREVLLRARTLLEQERIEAAAATTLAWRELALRHARSWRSRLGAVQRAQEELAREEEHRRAELMERHRRVRSLEILQRRARARLRASERRRQAQDADEQAVRLWLERAR